MSKQVDGMKKCNICSDVKPIGCFQRDGSRRDGLCVRCKFCEAVRQKARAKPDASLLTHAYLLSVLSYDQASGVFRWLHGLSHDRRGQLAGCPDSQGYIRIMLMKRLYKAHRLAWFYVHGRWPSIEIDHINGVRDDNRIDNLRDVDRFVQTQNTRLRANSSGFPGARRCKDGRWRSQIQVKGKIVQLGFYESPSAASEAYMHAKKTLHVGYVERPAKSPTPTGAPKP